MPVSINRKRKSFKVSISFSVSELINIAIGIERKGIAFYDIMAKSTENTAARGVFHCLTDMEREHVKIFQSMLNEADKYQPSETLTEEHTDYLQALVDNAVFTDAQITSEMAIQADSDMKALEFAIGVEKDSILFYYEMRDIMPKQAYPILNGIIAEEKSHLKQLFELKKELVSG